jgi:3D-(3,5/4)-trihydroxycyclohexane-1,2-dione acylhydrolase (decyclizing)
MSGEMSAADPTARLTVGQAVVRFLAAQRTERDGVTQRAIPAIFGHANVLGLEPSHGEQAEQQRPHV